MLGVLRLGMLKKFNSPLPLCWMGSAERAVKLRQLPPQERKRVSNSNSILMGNQGCTGYSQCIVPLRGEQRKH